MAEIDGLTEDYRSYGFTVAANNAAGTGPQCDMVYGIPITVPGPPKYIYAIPEDGQINFSWASSEWGGTVLYYIVYKDGIDIVNTSNNNVTITGLNNGQTYVFSFASHNLAGDSAQINIIAIPRAVPEAPTDLSATPGNGQVSLTWTAPANSYAAVIDGYTIYADGNNVWDTTYNSDALATSTIIHLNNGQTYNFTVAAHSFYSTGHSTPFGYIGQQSSGVLATPRPDTTNEPTDLSMTPGNEQVVLSWTPPSYNGGAAIDYYVIYQNNVDVHHNTTTSGIITGLTNGQTYSFTVAAHNSAGIGHNSSAIHSIPYGVPDAPTGLAGALANGKITLNWTAPVFDGGRAIDYYVVYQDGAALPYHLTGPSTIIAGLVNGQQYSFTVSAHNLAGLGTQSTLVTAMPSLAPSAPSAPTALLTNAGNARASLTWTAPTNNGSSSIDYYIVYQDGIDIAHPSSTSHVVTGLTNGVSYSFKVAAHNTAGTGPQTSSASATPSALTTILTVPNTPTGLTASPGEGQVSLSWTTPDSDGGAAIDFYIVYQDGSDVQHPTMTSAIITGLTNGQTYDLSIAAHNQIGTGLKTSSISATPNLSPTVPGEPIGLIATPGNSQVSLTWSAPGNDGGSVIDYYLVYIDGTARSEHCLTTSTTIQDLMNDHQYSFAIVAHNSIGIGELSSAVMATPTTISKIPEVPTGLVAAPGNGQVSLSWITPNNNGGAIIDFFIVYQDGVDTIHSVTTSGIVTGLTNGKTCNFTVAAHNSIGTGAQTTAVAVTPISSVAVPGKPTNLITTIDIAKVTLSWTAPADVSSIDYYIVYQNGIDIKHTSGTSAMITGLTEGESYSFAVAAHSSGGVGAQSSALTISPSNSDGATAPSGNDNLAYLSIALALLAVAIIGLIIVIRNRKNGQ
jgi:titin